MLLSDKGFFLRSAKPGDPAGARGFAQVSILRVEKIDLYKVSDNNIICGRHLGRQGTPSLKPNWRTND